ncbi:MAG: hypothetical protein ACRDMJ_01360 [Solirubrobacteraceae bacterium]
MADWVTISSLATAGGTLVLAVATFSSVRSANRSARLAERTLLAGLRPVLIPSREEDPVERVRFGDNHVLTVPGHGAATDEDEGVVYLAIALRNGGAGVAMLQGWRARAVRERAREELRPSPDGRGSRDGSHTVPDPAEFRRQQLDLLIPAGETGYWLGAIRDPEEAGYVEVLAAVRAGQPIQIDLLYTDQEGGQRTIARFIVTEWPEVEGDRAAVLRYWSIGGDDQR